MILRGFLRGGAAGSGRLLYGTGLLDRLGAEAARLLPPGPCVVVTDSTVARHYGARAVRSLRRAGFEPGVVALRPGEASKSLASVGRVLDALAARGAGRDAAVFALGGGVPGDVAGFAAAIYARGIPWIAVPTTLLAMADAAVGGKTGVDLPAGKNLAGAFHVPRLVLADAATLATLPRRHVRNGLAEVAKVALLDGLRDGLPRVRRMAGLEGKPAALARAAARAAAAKAALVARDPLERLGRRVLLNLGHTAGHGIEAATGFDGSVLHGEAVAIGIVAACRVAEGRRLLRRGEAEEVAEALRGLGLPTSLPRGLAARLVVARAGLDKKRARGVLRMVLPRSAARAVVRDVAPAEFVAALWS